MPNYTHESSQQLADAIEATARKLAKGLEPEDRFQAVTLRAWNSLTATVIRPGLVRVEYPGTLATTVTTWHSIVQNACTVAIDLATDIGTEWETETEQGHIVDIDGEPAVTFTW